MRIEQKVFLGENDSVHTAVTALKETPATYIIFKVPRGAAFAASSRDFIALKEAAEKEGKTVAIESTDDHILELAALAGIKGMNALRTREERPIADILPRRAAGRVPVHIAPETPKKKGGPYEDLVSREEKGTRRISPVKKAENAIEKITTVEEVLEADALFEAPDGKEREEKNQTVLEEIFGKEKPPQEEKPRTERKKPIRPRPIRIRSTKAAVTLAAIVCVLIAAGVWLVFFAFPKASIAIILKKTTVPVNEAVVLSAKATSVGVSGGKLMVPGELLTATQNTQMTFSANGEEATSSKATGILTVYNAYDATPQTLVAGTRFATPDGLIFRINKRITVPAAKVAAGKVTPASINAPASADASGERYNVAAGTKWTIPGFKGTPRYGGFYAVNAEGMTGGSSGIRRAPTPKDIAHARATIESALTDALKAKMAILLSNDITLLPQASTSSILKETEAPAPGDPSSFSLYAEGEMREFVYNASILRQGLIDQAKTGLPDGVEANSFNVVYGPPQIDFTNGSLTLSASGTIVFAAGIDTKGLAKSVAGLDESELRRIVFSLPGLENATITLWPFWVHTVPSNPAKIDISIR